MKTKDRVKNLLIKFPVLRDDVNLLVSVMWKADIKRMGFEITDLSGIDYSILIGKGQLTNFKTIDRMWRIVQEQVIGLRGEKWQERQNQEKRVRKDIVSDKIFL